MNVQKSSITGISLICSIILWSASASAQQPAPAPYPPPGYPPPAQQPAPPPPGYPPPGYPPPGYPPPAYQQPGYAPQPYPGVAAATDPTARRHDGFYLRMMLGPGYLSASGEEDGLETTIKGGGAAVDIAIGGAVSENFIVFGTIFGLTASEPDVEFKRGGNSVSAQLDDATFSSSGIGAGIAYYIMPMNLHIGGGLLLAQNRIELKDNDPSTDDEAESDTGVGVNLTIGKEWFVSDQWGLGIAAQLYGARIEESTTAGFGINFAATFN